MFRLRLIAFFILFFGAVSFVDAQVVEFRLETTDASGSVVDTIGVGEQFVLSVFTKQTEFSNTAAGGGVFAGYLDVMYEGVFASVAGDVLHGEDFPEGRNADLDQAGLLNNVGSFRILDERQGDAELLLWSLPMQADSVGELKFVGAESADYPVFEVLVYDSIAAVAPGSIAFGSTSLFVVPEPSGFALLLVGFLLGWRRFVPSRR